MNLTLSVDVLPLSVQTIAVQHLEDLQTHADH